jgi:hypothetical protein
MSRFRRLVGTPPAGVLDLPGAAQSTLTNLLLSGGPDPWAITRDVYYYFMCSTVCIPTVLTTLNLESEHKCLRRGEVR